MSMIEVSGLNFEYPGARVLHDISFTIEYNNITAMVGPNGAGKTTLLRCIAGLESPFSGDIRIDGIDVLADPRSAHRRIGYLSDFFGLYDDLTVRQCLTYMSWCHRIPETETIKRVDEVAEAVELTERLEERAGTLSRGYRQRLGVGLAIVHQPRVLLLDEPASGMDPEARIHLSELLHRLRDDGMTIVVSSHILSELEDYCTDMLVIREGRIIEHVALSEHEEQSALTLTIGITGLDSDHVAYLESLEEISAVRTKDNFAICEFTGNTEAQHDLLKRLISKKWPVYSFNTTRKSLSAAYMDLARATEQKQGDGEAA